MSNTQRVRPEELGQTESPVQPEVTPEELEQIPDESAVKNEISEKTLKEIAESHDVSVSLLEDVITWELKRSNRGDLDTKAVDVLRPDSKPEGAESEPLEQLTLEEILETSNDIQNITSEQIKSFGRITSISAFVLLITGLYGVYSSTLSPVVGGIGSVILLCIGVFAFYIQHFISADE